MAYTQLAPQIMLIQRILQQEPWGLALLCVQDMTWSHTEYCRRRDAGQLQAGTQPGVTGPLQTIGVLQKRMCFVIEGKLTAEAGRDLVSGFVPQASFTQRWPYLSLLICLSRQPGPEPNGSRHPYSFCTCFQCVPIPWFRACLLSAHICQRCHSTHCHLSRLHDVLLPVLVLACPCFLIQHVHMSHTTPCANTCNM